MARESSASAFPTAADTARRVRNGEISAVSVLEQCLTRIQNLQPRLNAFVTVCADEARAQAAAVDRARAAGVKLGPLAGVPVSVKDILNTKGVRTAWGSRLMESNVPAEDAVAVNRLKDAGAVILGKTTTPEFAYKLLTDSPISGITRNAWNAELTPCGSSGGSAVAVAAGMGPLSLATDAGASTRLPAACCGILGLKPTLGRVPHSQVPDAFNNFIHLGLMARTVVDCELMLEAIAGPHPGDPYSLVLENRKSQILRIEWRPLLGNTLLDAEVRSECEAALRGLGAEVRTVDEPFENAEAPWRVLQQSNWAARFFARLGEVEARIEPGFAAGIRAGGAYTGQQLLAATVKRTELFRKVQEWFERCDLVATPTMSRPPLSATHSVDEPITVNGRPAGDMRVAWAPYLNVFNLTGHPALSVPAGFTREGLPVGLQLVARWYAEADLFTAARALENARPWAERVPPEAA
jgi:aspartyl-tRNA(Asn)/glutamyl-tRNA(Gln) amidotransferase subunit A